MMSTVPVSVTVKPENSLFASKTVQARQKTNADIKATARYFDFFTVNTFITPNRIYQMIKVIWRPKIPNLFSAAISPAAVEWEDCFSGRNAINLVYFTRYGGIRMYNAYIVDDEKMAVNDMIDSIPWLENGFEVIGFNTDPETAIREIIEMKPDVVFCDLKMPGCDGIKLIQRIKEHEIYPEFIMLSAYAEFEASREFFRMGGLDYILKPLDHDSAALVLEKTGRKMASKYNQTPSVQFVPTQSVNFDDLVEYVTASFSKKITLVDLSEKFNMSQTYICDLFAKHYESTLKIFITNLRMKEASRLISESNSPLKEIAIFCGYSDYYYFCKVFKTHFDKSPSDYRDDPGEKHGYEI